MRLYQVKGAVHGFAVEWYRLLDDGTVERLGRDDQWGQSNLSRDGLMEQVREGHFALVPWTHYLDGLTDWRYRAAGPFVQILAGGVWGKCGVKPVDIPELVERGVLSEYPG